MAKMIEVARATELSLSTVSEILSGKPGYNEETRALVLAAAKRLNYTPNPISRALNGGRSNSIGLFVTSKATVYTVARRVEAIMREASRAGYHVYMTYAAGDQTQFAGECLSFARDMLSRRVDGLILHGQVTPKTRAFLEKQNCPTIYIDSPGASPSAAGIVIHRRQGIRQAAEHLCALGHHEIGVTITPDLSGKTSPRESLYREELTSAGLTMLTSPEWPSLTDSGQSGAFYDAFRRAAAMHQLPTALMLNNDEAAFLACSALRDSGYRIPQDISIVGFDDVPLARHFSPALTTISMPCSIVGQHAFQLLREKIDQLTCATKALAYDTALIIRETTGPAPGR